MGDLLSHAGVEENLHFLILEVRKQLDRVRRYLERPSPKLADRVATGDDYIDNLKRIIHRKCYMAAAAPGEEGAPVELLRAVDVIASNMEHISDFCEDILDQYGYIDVPEVLRRYDFTPCLEEVARGLDRVKEALFHLDVQAALDICRCEHQLDLLYGQSLRRLLEELQAGRNTRSLVTIIFIYRYFERMGDSLLNIGEAIVSACLGERIKIDQFRALEDSLEEGSAGEPLADLSLRDIGETRSGCRIGRVSRKSTEEGGRSTIFKAGRREKMEQEREGIERWQKVLPDLVPRVYSFHQEGDQCSMLVEYLQGRTFEALLLGGSGTELNASLGRLCHTLTDVWNATRVDEPAPSQFLGQIAARLEDVYALHPRFRRGGGSIGELRALAFDELLERAASLESGLPAPFTVLGHGDFNVDNILYDPREDRVHFIDLHRSRIMDYVQDISVFLVSNYRLQVFEAPIRRRIERIILRFHDFAQGYAAAAGDRTFNARLALGLARSFVTSTRFMLDRSSAKAMFLRSRYILENLLAQDRERLKDLSLTRDVLVE